MTGSLHNALLGLALHGLRLLPAPVIRALDAWSARVARRRALERQRLWQRKKAGGPASVAATVYHLKPWRD